ncbi:MAG: TlpA disulfide reductase family protein [Longimicrobiales bacterium]
MTPLTGTLLIGGAALTIGAFVLYRSVRREGWKHRVLSWVGAIIGVAFMGFGGLLGYAAWSERHTFAGPDRPTAEELARPAEPFAYRLVADDGEGHLATYQGDVILINLWATWCGPCLKEMPYLEQLQEEYGPDGLTVVTLTKEDRTTALTQAHRLPSNTVNAHAPDQGALPQPFRRGFRALPTSYVIGRDGYIREFFIGSRQYDDLVEKVEPYLAKN